MEPMLSLNEMVLTPVPKCDVNNVSRSLVHTLHSVAEGHILSIPTQVCLVILTNVAVSAFSGPADACEASASLNSTANVDM